MVISGTCGNQKVSSLDALLRLLRNSRKGNFGEFWLGEKDSPVMVIHTNGDLAYLHYFPANDHPGFQAVGDKAANGEVTFTQEGEVDFSMPLAVVVSVNQAYQAATAFFQSPSLPSCIEWTEL